MGRKQALRRAELKSAVAPQVEDAFNAVKAELQREVTQTVLDLDWRVWIVALNESLGLGKKRLTRAIHEVNRTYADYDRERREGDLEYAEAVLDRNVARIMGKDFFLQSREDDA